MVDEFTRERLAIEVERSIDADHVVRVLERLARERRAPRYVRFDGPEFIAFAVADWCRINSTGTLFIDPGSPWQNPVVESSNGRLRDEILNHQLFDTLFEAKVLLEDHRIDYNMNRAHSAHGWNPPPRSLSSGSPDTSSYSHREWTSDRGPVRWLKIEGS